MVNIPARGSLSVHICSPQRRVSLIDVYVETRNLRGRAAYSGNNVKETLERERYSIPTAGGCLALVLSRLMIGVMIDDASIDYH